MIYIITNGEIYSDHTIVFVESSYPTDVLELCTTLKWRSHGSPRAKILGVAKSVTWYVAEVMPDYEFMSVYDLCDYTDKLFPAVAKLPPELLHKVWRVRFEELTAYRERADSEAAKNLWRKQMLRLQQLHQMLFLGETEK